MELRRRRDGRQSSRPSKTEGGEKVTLKTTDRMDWLARRPAWIMLAIGSGACAAINGVFAKMTTTASTTDLSEAIASSLGLDNVKTYIDLALRGTFLGLNICFNVAMWTLFTMALTRATSTTQVSIINVSSNFMITAVLGALVFGESLPLGWWAGAALLGTGNIIIGKREEVVRENDTTSPGEHTALSAEFNELSDRRSEGSSDSAELGEAVAEHK